MGMGKGVWAGVAGLGFTTLALLWLVGSELARPVPGAPPAPVSPAKPAVLSESSGVSSASPRAVPTPVPSLSVGAPPPFPNETSYLTELARLNVQDKPRALALAREGDRWYPSVGKGAEARKAMTVTLLVDLGNMTEARQETERFIAQFPESSYRPLVQGVTGIHPRPEGPGSAR